MEISYLKLDALLGGKYLPRSLLTMSPHGFMDLEGSDVSQRYAAATEGEQSQCNSSSETLFILNVMHIGKKCDKYSFGSSSASPSS